MRFERSFSMGNVVTLVVLVAGLAAQWGGFQSVINDHDRRLVEMERGLGEMRKDNRVTEALQRVAVIENNVLWIRADVSEIKKSVKGAQ